jgi:hypothetical protein
MPNCLCSHPPAEHHLERMTVECWGELAYVINDDKTDGFHVEHCDCRAYEPVTAAGSLNPS